MKSHPKPILAKSQTPYQGDEHQTFLMETGNREPTQKRDLGKQSYGKPLFAGGVLAEERPN